LIPESQKQSVHLQIGRLLLANTAIESDEQIFALVNQLNRGLKLIDSTERETIARLNLQAGQKANASTAYRAAVDYLLTSQQLLNSDAWQSQYSLSLEIANQLALGAFLSGDFEQMQQTIDQVVAQTRSLLEQVTVYEIKIQALILQGQPLEAVKTALLIVEKLGVKFPFKPTTPQVLLGLAETKIALLGKSTQTLENQSAMTAPDKIAVTQILAKTLSAAYIAAPDLMPLLVFRKVNLFAKYGNTNLAAFTYAWYGLILCGVVRDIQTGYQFGELALKLLEKFNAKEIKSRVLFIVYYFIFHWKNHLKDTLAPLLESYQTGLETGDTEYASWAALIWCANSYYAGHNLSEVSQKSRFYTESIGKLNQETAELYCKIFYQTTLCLLGEAETTALEGEVYRLSEMEAEQQAINDKTGLFFAYTNQATLRYLFADFDQARQTLQQGRQYEDGGIAASGLVVFYFYDSLTCLAEFKQASQSQQRDRLKQVASNQKKMKQWVQYAPMNCQHKWYLIEAERYRILNKLEQAIKYYDQSIAKARENDYIQEAALANELAAKFYLEWGKEKIAAGYMQEAYFCYARWGAKAKTDDLETRYPHLLRPILQQTAQPLTILETLATSAAPNYSIHSSTRNSTSSTSINNALDFSTLLQISQAISSTIELDELLQTLTQTLLENSGADGCALMLCQDQQWQVRVLADLEHSSLQTEPLENNPNVAVKLIQYVKNTLETVVIDDLDTNLNGVIDDYLQRQQPKSVLCLPILNQGNLVGILYLENRGTSGVFTRDRLLVLNFISSQAAISLENARLYQESISIQQQLLQQKQELERSQTQLIANKSALRAILDNAPIWIWMIDIHGKMLFVNKTFCDDVGVPEEIFTTASHYREAIGEEAAQNCMKSDQACLAQDTPYYFTEILPLVDGKSHTLETVKTPIKDKDNRTIGIVGLGIDVTEREQMAFEIQEKNNNLEKALQELQHAQLQMIQSEKMSALGNLVAGVAHEINNPIGFLSGNIQPALDYINDVFGLLDLYQQKYPNPDPEIDAESETIDLDYIREDLPKLVGSMREGVKRILDISTSLRTFSRADSDRSVAYNLHDGIDSTILILKHRLKANEHRPEIEVITDYGDLPQVECFAGQLNQVFMNLLANAIDALEEGNQGRSFADIKANPNRIILKTELSADQQQAVIRIKDNGIGMTDAVKQKIFEHLFTTKGVGKGTGLGLAIAQQIVVEKHGGAIAVNSQIGKGTEFVLTLPLL